MRASAASLARNARFRILAVSNVAVPILSNAQQPLIHPCGVSVLCTLDLVRCHGGSGLDMGGAQV